MTMVEPAGVADAVEGLGGAGEVRGWKADAATPPLVIEPLAERLRTLPGFIAWLRANRPAIDELLVKHGGIVFRGFPLRGSADFNAFAEAFEPFAGNYQGGATPRNQITGRVYEATQLSRRTKIKLHQEMAYIERGPRKIAFFCQRPADVGGETIFADMREVTREIPLALRERLEAHGVIGVRNFEAPSSDGQERAVEAHPDLRSWKFAFYTDDKADVEAQCRAKGMEPIWREDGGLAVRNHMRGMVEHPATGERVYRSTLHTDGGRDLVDNLPEEARLRVEEMFARQTLKTGFYLGDGSTLTREELGSLQSAFEQCELAWPWQAGDVMILDNLLMAHGRNPYQGARDVQVALLD
jgi:alpha-ketoglutarate-dependent taurine dioxygenase